MERQFTAQGKHFVVAEDGKIYQQLDGGLRRIINDPLSQVFVRAADISGVSDPINDGYYELGCVLTTIFGKEHKISGVLKQVADNIDLQIMHNPNQMMEFELLYPSIPLEEVIKNGLLKIEGP